MEHVETQEFAETLMNPTPHTSLLGKDSRVGGNVGLRLLMGGEKLLPPCLGKWCISSALVIVILLNEI